MDAKVLRGNKGGLGGFWLNGFSRILAKIRWCKEGHGSPKLGLNREEDSEEPKFGQGETLCQYFL